MSADWIPSSTDRKVVSLAKPIMLVVTVIEYGNPQVRSVSVTSFTGVSLSGLARYGGSFPWAVEQLLTCSYISGGGTPCAFSEYPVRLVAPVEVYLASNNIIAVQEGK